jgi:hypothetical protein
VVVSPTPHPHSFARGRKGARRASTFVEQQGVEKMSLSSLAGDGSITGDGSIGGDGSIAGDGSARVGADGGVSTYLSSALVTTRDGIVGSWTNPEEKPDKSPDDAEPADLGARMRLWDARVRAQVLDFELLSAFGLDVDVNGSQAVAKLLVRDNRAVECLVRDNEAVERLVRDKGALEGLIRGRSLVELERPSSKYLLEDQLKHVYSYADLRRDRTAEILSQIKGIDIFLGRFSPLHPERHRYTLELLAAFNRALVSTEMRIKHALAVPRPVEFSPQIMPMIQTPGHGSFPAGHAAESFMGATVLFALMKAGNGRYADVGWDDRLARLAARISVNRVIAGVHFPVDLAAGLVLGLTVGRYFVALARGKEAQDPPKTYLKSYKFDPEAYGPREFPWAADNKGWAKFPWTEILDPKRDLPAPLAGQGDTATLTLPDKKSSPLCWLWGEAVKEWQDCRAIEARHDK